MTNTRVPTRSLESPKVDFPTASFSCGQVSSTWALPRLAGEVSVGYVRGTRIELTADLVNCDLSGELRAAAERRRPLIARFARSPW